MFFDRTTLLIFLFIACILVILLIYSTKTMVSMYVDRWFQRAVLRKTKIPGVYRGTATLQVFFRYFLFLTLPIVVWLIFENYISVLIVILLLYKIPILFDTWRTKKRRNKLEQELPIALAMIASGLSSGSSLTSAIAVYVRESKSPLAQELSHFVRVQKLGVEIDEALDQVDKRVNILDFTLVILAMRISKSVGGNLSETLINLSNAIQLKLIIEGKIKSLTAQGVMQAWVMSLLPAFVGVALTFIQPGQMDKLFNTLTGNAVLAACLILDYIGFKLIKKILTIDV